MSRSARAKKMCNRFQLEVWRKTFTTKADINKHIHIISMVSCISLRSRADTKGFQASSGHPMVRKNVRGNQNKANSNGQKKILNTWPKSIFTYIRLLCGYILAIPSVVPFFWVRFIPKRLSHLGTPHSR